MEAKDSVPAQDSYYPYPAQLPGANYGPPPVYGPPPEVPNLPTGNVEIEFAFDSLILRCIVEEPLEVSFCVLFYKNVKTSYLQVISFFISELLLSLFLPDYLSNTSDLVLDQSFLLDSNV